jgi:hypothetical protein
MPSPFPGMDPYLEDPDLWPGFHNALADRTCETLNRQLPVAYFAQLEARSELGIVGEPPDRIAYSDVSVRRAAGETPARGGVATLPSTRTEISPSVSWAVERDLVELTSVSIRAAKSREVVTWVEILSPANKQRGPDRRSYLRKQADIFDSQASLIELDLLRSGARTWDEPEFEGRLRTLTPPPDYLIVVNRAWERGRWLQLQAFPLSVRDTLPCIPVPLRRGEAELPLDVQAVFQLAYDAGPYRRGAVDYAQPPAPPVPRETAAWVAERVQSLLTQH